MPKPFSVIERIYFCLAITSDFLSLSSDPFLRIFLAIFGLISAESKTDKEITLSSFPSSMPFIPFEDLPLNIRNYLDINLIHFPRRVLKIIS